MRLCGLALLFSLSIVACGGAGAQEATDGDDVSVAESNETRVTPGEIELDDHPHAVATACDVHTHLSLTSAGGSKATLTEIVGGMCRLAVDPDARAYRLRLTSTECGSRTYQGSRHDAAGSHTLTIVDHRARVCDDVVDAPLVVTETLSGAATIKYSRDIPPPSGQAITVTGTLVRTVGPGGENTGTSVATSNKGTLELILDAGEENEFAEGQTARIKGTVKYLSGVETHDRKAIDVTEILLCPATNHIDCTPGPGIRLSSYCSSGNRSWVATSCSGVVFTE